MKKIMMMLMMIGIAGVTDAQTYKSKAKNSTIKAKHETTTNIKTTMPAQKSAQKTGMSSQTMSGSVPAGALPASGVIVYDSTVYDNSRYNPYQKFSPAEIAPDDPAPGLENAGRPRNRLPNTDVIMEPRK